MVEPHRALLACLLVLCHALGDRHFNLALHELHRVSAQCNALTVQLAHQRSAARRELLRAQRLLAKPLAPVRRQRTVQRAGNRIFRDAVTWCKETTDEIDLSPRRAHADASEIERSER